MATILIVDDRAVNREFLVTLLGYHRHRLLEAGDGEHALALARAEHPDLVISDILMPTMDGYEFVRRLRADPALVATPVIFYTAHYHGPEAEKLARDCGVAYILTKPTEPETVLQTVAQALGESNPPMRAVSPDFDREHLQILTDKLSEEIGELRRTSERFAALNDVNLQLASERDPRRLLDSVCHAARELTAAKYALLAVGNESGAAAHEFTTSGLEAETVARIGKPEWREGAVRAALLRGKPLRVMNPGGDPAAVGLPLQHLPVYALLVAPILSLTHNYGWIALVDKLGAEGFSAGDERLVTALGAQLGRFYENNRLYAEMRRHAVELQESELRFRQLAENIREVFFLMDPSDTRVIYISPAYEEVWGRSVESLYADPQPWVDAIHPDDRERVVDTFESIKATGRFDYEYRIVRGDKTIRWIWARGFPIRNEAGAIYRIAGIAEDITDQKQAAEELRESQRRFSDMLGNVQLVSLMLDREARITYCNDYLLQLTGWRREEVLGRDWFAIFIPPEVDKLKDTFAALITDDPAAWHHDNDILTRTGERRMIRWNNSVLRSASGEIVGTASIGEDVTERVRLETALREREAGLRRAQLVAKLAHVITKPDGSFESWSETLPQLIGADPSQMPHSTREWLDFLHPEDRPALRATAIQAGIEGTRKELEYRLRGADGAWTHVWQVMEPILGGVDAQGKMRWFITLQDVTEQKQAEHRIQRLNRVHAVLSGINTTIVRVREREELFRDACRIVVDAGQFRLAWIGMVDREAKRLNLVAWHGAGDDYVHLMPLDLDANQVDSFGMAGRAVKERKPLVSDDMARDPRVLLAKESARRGLHSLAVLPLAVAGEVAGVLALYSEEIGFFDAEEMKLLLELAGDISFALDNIAKEERLEYLAFYDPLTDVPNRSLFRERLNQRVGAANRDEDRLAVVLLDTERFNTVNDSLGRQTGDELLRQIAARCLSFAADPGLVARLVGDQFAVLVPDVRSEENAARILEQWNREIFGSSYRIDDTDLRVSAKYGIAMFPGDGTDADSLLKNAEAALQRAKATGERYLFYTQQMTERVAGRLSLENKLRHALENFEFVLHYQPKVDVETRRIVGVEALMRWQSPDLGLVPPLRFIPLLEETGMILDVGAWALRRAILDYQQLLEHNLTAPRIAVNVSAIQLRHRDFVDIIRDAVRHCAGPPIIDIEITESVLMRDIADTVDKLRAIRDMGLNIAIDDFGTGYSSLGYLARLPVHSLKIDRSFIITMVENPDTMTLVSTIISLAHSLRLTVCAEGVETEEQAKVLRLLRCDELQGYLISRPVPLDMLTPLLGAG